MRKYDIVDICASEMLDSRGNPTVKTYVKLAGGASATATVPSGASKGTYEAFEMRDGDNERYAGKGVFKAVASVNNQIRDALLSLDATDQRNIDKTLIDIDGTDYKTALGANAILSVSIAVCKAAARAQNIPLYRYLGGSTSNVLPVPLMNIINGGAHASNNLDIQEFMIVPIGAINVKTAIRQCSEIYHCLGEILKSKGHSTGIGDEGGYAPDLKNDQEAIELIIAAIEKAGYCPGEDTFISLDAAASEWYDGNSYTMPKQLNTVTTEQLSLYWCSLTEKYPIFSIEDPFAQNDFSGFTDITNKIGKKLKIIGDDIFATNKERILLGIKNKLANGVIIKPNQVGTVSETADAIRLAHKNGYTCVISHRSGDTAETFISDLTVAFNTGYIKAGAPCRSERTEKYNRLMEIENEMQTHAIYSNGLKI